MRLKEQNYINGLKEIHDGANSPNMQDILCHSQLLGSTIGNRMHIFSQSFTEAKLEKCGLAKKIHMRQNAKTFEYAIQMMQAQVYTLPYPLYEL